MINDAAAKNYGLRLERRFAALRIEGYRMASSIALRFSDKRSSYEAERSSLTRRERKDCDS